jgi:hypothetical protein
MVLLYKENLWGGGKGGHPSLDLLRLGCVTPQHPLTLRETRDNGLSSIIETVLGNLGAERSRFSDHFLLRTSLRVVLLLLATQAGVFVNPRRSQDCEV